MLLQCVCDSSVGDCIASDCSVKNISKCGQEFSVYDLFVNDAENVSSANGTAVYATAVYVTAVYVTAAYVTKACVTAVYVTAVYLLY